MSKPTILVSNDDGYRAPGILALADIAREFGKAFTIAPDRERSACGHSLTIHRPLRVEAEEPGLWAVDGTPTDCIHLGIKGDILEQKPDLVLTGINHGSNLGDEITYSGTVGGAMEAALLGLPAIAFSCVSTGHSRDDLALLAPFFKTIISDVLTNGLTNATLLNVNCPDPRRREIKGLRVTVQGTRKYGAEVIEKADPRKRQYYWIGGAILDHPNDDGTDVDAVDNGYISVTPVQLDLTDHRQITPLKHRLGSKP